MVGANLRLYQRTNIIRVLWSRHSTDVVPVYVTKGINQHWISNSSFEVILEYVKGSGTSSLALGAWLHMSIHGVYDLAF